MTDETGWDWADRVVSGRPQIVIRVADQTVVLTPRHLQRMADSIGVLVNIPQLQGGWVGRPVPKRG